ncbi:MAG: cellulase family glycosylhydrolase [Massilibacteroides sp.]|nr:cellulase family glycosylhydrolase [Massilibacteroides sp.]MDD3062550.1 cellulase family glycosylhydrolase [Massilibacteroides sp.]MDD4114517.1 cellulase family glycosylhydrolase [Massilibacteroides sp.]MDD4659358.1 cellulase family glycosylhydrolase [Massilibacteroides sp.]
MRFLYVSLLVLLFSGCVEEKKENEDVVSFVQVRDGQFLRDNKPIYFIGVNFWYAPILGSQGEFGDRKRLLAELNFMQANGITNVRVLVGADGPDGIPSKISPTLQRAPGVYHAGLLDGLDFFLNELSKRNMYAVLYFHNTWEWSGGYAQYLNWSGYGPVPIPSIDGWDAFNCYVSSFFDCESCTVLFKKHIRHILMRTNFYNKRKYVEDPTILSWQIANEPRPMGEANKAAYEKWLKEIAAYIKNLDSNHLVSTGSEGEVGSEDDFDLYKRVHSDPNIDYLTIHVWPKNWGWIDEQNITATLDSAIIKTDHYLKKHLELARILKKPIVLEEFGLPRDHHRYKTDDSTTARDKYYEHIFRLVSENAVSGDVLAGCNFWAWGGFARPSADHVFWMKGDEYIGDPAQEEQGLNSVFDTDTTIELIKRYSTLKLNAD